MNWYWCLIHNRVEPEAGCPHSERLGPFPTEAAAAQALDTARARNDAWDAAEDD